MRGARRGAPGCREPCALIIREVIFPTKMSKRIQIHPLTTWTKAVIASWAAGEGLLVLDEAGGEEDQPRVGAGLVPIPAAPAAGRAAPGTGAGINKLGAGCVLPAAPTDAAGRISG